MRAKLISVQGNSDVIEFFRYGEIIVKPHCIFGVANQSKSLINISGGVFHLLQGVFVPDLRAFCEGRKICFRL